jgi:hypothetical protein
MTRALVCWDRRISQPVGNSRGCLSWAATDLDSPILDDGGQVCINHGDVLLPERIIRI